MHFRSLSHTLSNEVLEKLRKVAEREGISELTIIEFALNIILDREPSPMLSAKLQDEQTRFLARRRKIARKTQTDDLPT